MLDGEEDEEGVEEVGVFFTGSILDMAMEKRSPGKPSPQLPSG